LRRFRVRDESTICLSTICLVCILGKAYKGRTQNGLKLIETRTQLRRESENIMAKMQSKNLSKPDETKLFDKCKIELATLGGVTFGRGTLQPGWKWSTCIKPVAKTQSCQAPHLQYHVSGRLAVLMDDGTQQEFGPGDISLLPPGHDAWVVGNEPVQVIDISGMGEFAKPHAH
jgi:hypothetical protein